MYCTIILRYHKSKCQLNGIVVMNQNKVYLSKTHQGRQVHMNLWLRSIFPAPDLNGIRTISSILYIGISLGF